MLKKMKIPSRHMIAGIGVLAAVVCVCIGFTGCRGEEAEEERQEMEFTVVGEKDVPQALAELIARKKENSFKLTYADGQDMYITVGAGPQTGGGYSMVVRELYRTDNSVVIKTELVGPESGEAGGSDLSYPVLIVKTEYLDLPVVFK